MKRGLALEGGGARGAYHLGVVKALYENGYEFDGFTGTSIGAINAAVLAQGDFDLALQLWENISMEQLVDVDEQALFKLANIYEIRIDKQLPLDIKNAVKKIISGRGLSTDKMKILLETYLSEEKLRNSGKDFGLVTFSLTERKPYELLLGDIPQGKVLDYIMASASFPGFRPEKIDERKYVDGGFYNNCPINLLVDNGYDEVIAVRTTTLAIIRKVDEVDKVKYIVPREDLGNMMWFAPEHSRANMELGYYDGLRFVKNLRGASYYIYPICVDDFHARLMSLDDSVILDVGEVLGIAPMPAKRMLFEKIIPSLSGYLKPDKEKNFDYADFVIALLEHAASQRGINRFCVYDFPELCSLVADTAVVNKEEFVIDLIIDRDLTGKKKTAADMLSGCLLSP